MVGFVIGPSGVLPSASVAATAFNPANAAGLLVFSNGNLTVSHTSGTNTNDGAWSLAGTTTNQKVYVELSSIVFTSSCAPGFSNSPGNNAPNFGGANATPTRGFVINQSGQFLCLDSVDNTTPIIPSHVSGDTIDIAFDTSTLKVWARKNGGAWNASLGGTQDPVTGQGGANATITGGGPYFYYVGFDGLSGDTATATFASASWARIPPAGFGQINA